MDYTAAESGVSANVQSCSVRGNISCLSHPVCTCVCVQVSKNEKKKIQTYTFMCVCGYISSGYRQNEQYDKYAVLPHMKLYQQPKNIFSGKKKNLM